MSRVFSVEEVTLYVKQLLEGDPLLQEVEVSGEVSNLTYHRSGHVYFSLKDAQAQLNCVMFRTYAQRAERIKAGEKIIARGDMTVYPPRGNYQLMVRSVRKEGVGDLYQQFLALRERLRKEGLFDERHKRPLPPYPRRIAVLSSPTGAAVRDVLRTLRRRYPPVEAIVVPTVVQGEKGRASIVRSLAGAADLGVDLIILARGGGSLEDLWNFNEEAVARAIHASPVPVITGVGHETDFTIADFVADFRASTPTAAAEHAVPDQAAIRGALREYDRQLQRGLRHFIDFKRQLLDDYSYRMEQAVRRQVLEQRHQLNLLETRLKGLDMRSLLSRGYTLTLRDGQLLRSREEVASGDVIETLFKDGRVRSQVVDAPEQDASS